MTELFFISVYFAAVFSFCIITHGTVVLRELQKKTAFIVIEAAPLLGKMFAQKQLINGSFFIAKVNNIIYIEKDELQK